MKDRIYFDERWKEPWVARYKLLTLCRKLDVGVEYVLCRQSNVGGSAWFFELKLKKLE